MGIVGGRERRVGGGGSVLSALTLVAERDERYRLMHPSYLKVTNGGQSILS